MVLMSLSRCWKVIDELNCDHSDLEVIVETSKSSQKDQIERCCWRKHRDKSSQADGFDYLEEKSCRKTPQHQFHRLQLEEVE
jgi:hypothetical protein